MNCDHVTSLWMRLLPKFDCGLDSWAHPNLIVQWNGQLVLEHYHRCWTRCCIFYYPIQTYLATNKVVASYMNIDNWLVKIMWELCHTWDLVTYCKTSLPWLVKCATCTDFVANRRTSLYFLQKLFATFNNLLNSCKTGRCDSWVVKRTSLFNLFCRNVAKQVLHFCCPFSSTLRER